MKKYLSDHRWKPRTQRFNFTVVHTSPSVRPGRRLCANRDAVEPTRDSGESRSARRGIFLTLSASQTQSDVLGESTLPRPGALWQPLTYTYLGKWRNPCVIWRVCVPDTSGVDAKTNDQQHDVFELTNQFARWSNTYKLDWLANNDDK